MLQLEFNELLSRITESGLQAPPPASKIAVSVRHAAETSSAVRAGTADSAIPTMMMPPMQEMAAPLALASAFCHVATIAVIANMHIQPRTLPIDQREGHFNEVDCIINWLMSF